MAEAVNIGRDAVQHPIPRTLGRYEVIGVLGRGGMATVYLARHVGEAGFQRLLAIKVLHPNLAHEQEFVSMLLDEARIAARLHHPNLVPIVDLGSEGGLHYVVMEYVEGCALSALLSKYRQERPPRLIIPILLDALTGLHAAHTLTDEAGLPMNLAHRDVSPQNVMVGVDATARVTDFGIARAEARINSTRPGQMKGKIAFMSPEQIRDSSNLDFRSDIFAMGVMLWTALTGRRLFRGSSDAATLSNILSMDIPAPSSIGLEPPAAFDDICLRALERDPDQRFGSAQEMEEALRDAAMANGLLGSKRELAGWVTAAFDDELTERRNAIRSAVSQVSSTGRGTMPSVSGFRVIPSVGTDTPPDGPTPPGLKFSPSQAPTIAAPFPQKSSKAPLIAMGAGLVVCAGIAAWLAFHGSPKAVASENEPATSAAAPEKPAPVDTQANKKEDPPAQSAEPVKSAEAPAASAAPTPPVATAPKPVVRHYVRHVRKPPPPAKPAPPPPEPPKKARAWDNDSPLPPQ